MAFAITLRGFNDRSSTFRDHYFSFDRSFPLLIFYVLGRNEEVVVEVRIFAKRSVEFRVFDLLV